MADFKLLTLGVPLPIVFTGTGFGSFAINEATDQVELIFQVPTDNDNATISITRLGYRLLSVSSPPVFKISLQGVANQFPDGTIKGGGSPASATFTPSGANTWNWVTLDNAYTAARGEFLAIVIAYDSGTVGAGNLATFNQAVGSGSVGNLPYSVTNNAGARTASNAYPVYGYGTASKAYGFPVQTITSTAFSSDSTPDEYALNFTLPASFVSTYKVVGARWHGTAAAAGKSTKMVLYDGTTALQDITWDSDTVAGAATVRPFTLYFDEATLSLLAAGTAYRLALQPQDAANSISPIRFQFAASADMEALPGGSSFFNSTRTDAGAWTDVTTDRFMVELIIQDWTAPVPGRGGALLTAGGGGRVPVY